MPHLLSCPLGAQLVLGALPEPIQAERAEFETWALSWADVADVAGFRTPSRNQEVGGDPESQHLLGLAADFNATEQVLDQIAAQALDRGFVPVPGIGRNGVPYLHVQRFMAGHLASIGTTFPV